MINECIPFGTIPESSNLQLEEVLEPDGETTNTYLTCQIILWTGRFNIMDAAYNDSIYFNQSCELSINDYHWKENDILANLMTNLKMYVLVFHLVELKKCKNILLTQISLNKIMN